MDRGEEHEDELYWGDLRANRISYEDSLCGICGKPQELHSLSPSMYCYPKGRRELERFDQFFEHVFTETAHG